MGLQRVVSRVAELAVALHLQRCQVEQSGRSLLSLFLLDVGDGEGQGPDALQQSLALFPVGYRVDARVWPVGCGLASGGLPLLFLGGQVLVTLPDDGREGGVAVDRAQLPRLLGDEVLYLQLAVDDECQRGGLHPPDGQHLPPLAILQGVQARGVHAQQPVADGPAQPGLVERLEVGGRRAAWRSPRVWPPR